jgi:hypothetical protein
MTLLSKALHSIFGYSLIELCLGRTFNYNVKYLMEFMKYQIAICKIKITPIGDDTVMRFEFTFPCEEGGNFRCNIGKK